MKAIQVEDGVHKAVKLKCLENEVGIAVITEALLLAWVEGKVKVAVPKPVVRQVKEVVIGEPKPSGSKVVSNPERSESVEQPVKKSEVEVKRSWMAEDKVTEELEREETIEKEYSNSAYDDIWGK